MEQYAQHRSVSIAMVDNDRMALMALSSLLTRAGFTVMWTAQLGAAAIQRCIRAQDRPDVLLVDMALSDMTGIDVCQAVRRWAPDLPMIGVTAYDPDVYRDAAVAAGAAAVISKDDISAIAAAVRRFFTRRQSAIIADHTASESHRTSTSSAGLHESPTQASDPHTDPSQRHPVSTTSPSDRPVSTQPSPPQRSFALSTQQTAIMRMYADGRSTDEIAVALGISKGTIFSQVARVREKLHARDRDEAVALCRRYLRM
ncbi:LuxR family two component transcriptional regulator [Bifidobacterium ramosum]|uniref:LuxR family two component transcriptional regulator n=1 Tax=Bifidobacterium ramosum TaxID=1798158 RepID=A0A6L4X2Y7_9BIFI|nr:response regulator transcription factor [Bifidobacterium ramosum]KAB8288751.1 LuxR family two component transcriptional regulator [Bifidobacterium ramosum]NEG71386.1 response regulator [Bifidobacterium ramosum]